MSTARIRAANVQDLDGLLRLEALFPSDRLTRPALRRLLRVPSAQIYVAVQQAEVVGDVVVLRRQGSDAARVYSLVVAPAARGQGLGGRLIARAEQAARQAGLARLRLEVRTDNTAARALYAGRGYQQVAALSGYYEDGSDGLRLEKQLGHRSRSAL